MSTIAANAPEVGSPARLVVELLARREQMTIAELVGAMGVTTTAVRLQVNRLLAEGWVEASKRRGGPGRPADVLRLSAAGRQLFGQRADDLCKLIIDELLESEGVERTRRIMRGVSKRLAAQFRGGIGEGEAGDANGNAAGHTSSDAAGQMGNGAAAEQLRRFAELMNEKGVLVDAERCGRGNRLTVYTCPFPDLVADHPVICEMERAAIGELLAADVQLDCCMAAGDKRCEFHVGEA